MSKQVWRKPEAVRVSVKAATRGVVGSPQDSCGEGVVAGGCS
jgi:hypothetical protein